jgi:hypothetical protein
LVPKNAYRETIFVWAVLNQQKIKLIVLVFPMKNASNFGGFYQAPEHKNCKIKKKYIDDILHCKILRLNPGQLAEKFGNFAFMIIALPV